MSATPPRGRGSGPSRTEPVPPSEPGWYRYGPYPYGPSAQGSYPPGAYPPQAYPPQAYPPQAYPPGAYQPQAYPPQAYPPPAPAPPPPAVRPLEPEALARQEIEAPPPSPSQAQAQPHDQSRVESGAPEPGPAPNARTTPQAPAARSATVDRGPIVGGFILASIGLFLLLVQLVPDAGQWIPLLVGLVFIAAFVARREYGLLVAGSIISGVGLGIVLSDAAASEISDAVLVLSIAAGFVAIWVVASLLRLPGNHWWPFIPGGILALVGAIQLAEADVGGVLRWWPLVLIAIGVLIVVDAPRRSRRRHP